MSTFTKQVIKDHTTAAVIKLTGVIDAGGAVTSDVANTTIVVAQLSGARDVNGLFPRVGAMKGLYETAIKKINYVVTSDTLHGTLTLNWRGSTANANICALQGAGTIDFEEMGGLIAYNGVGSSGNSGDIFVSSNGINGGSYTLIVHLKKNNRDFSAGENVDPALIKSVSV